MDNISRFYRERYKTAEQMSLAGNRLGCLDICWNLRLQPDLSLYRRALVNLLIATNADIIDHPDKRKFADECIALIDQVHREGSSDDEGRLQRIRSHASYVLSHINDIEEPLLELFNQRKAVDKTVVLDDKLLHELQEELKNRQSHSSGEPQQSTTDKTAESGDLGKRDISVEGPETRSIEGIYTDLGHGSIRKLKQTFNSTRRGHQLLRDQMKFVQVRS